MKVIRIVNAAFWLVAIASLVAGTKAQSRQFLVSGRAIDQNGVPLANVTATLYSQPCRNCIDHVVPSNRGLPDGAFFVDSRGTWRDRFTLYLEESVPAGFWSPLGGPPFSDLGHLPEFRGIRIRPPRDAPQIDLGDVKVRIRFGKVMVKVPEKWREIASETSRLHLRLHDRTGALIYDGELPASVANTKSDLVKLALIPGRWKMQLALQLDKQVFRSPARSVSVRLNSCEVVSFAPLARTQPC